VDTRLAAPPNADRWAPAGARPCWRAAPERTVEQGATPRNKQYKRLSEIMSQHIGIALWVASLIAKAQVTIA
jgi:hypothetical protein